MPDVWKNRRDDRFARAVSRVTGRLFVGTSGFAYRDWAPLFYPAGTPPRDLLAHYAGRLPAVELNNTFYQQPRPDRVAGWLAAVTPEFRFAVKAQRGGSLRAIASAPADRIAWLTAPYRAFGDHLGAVLFRVPKDVIRDDDRLSALLAAWPPDMPLAVELQHPSWHVDEVLEILARRHVALCATDLDDGAPPDLRLTGRFIYLRLRRAAYSSADLLAWARRLGPFRDAGSDCYVFLRHDERGELALRAVELMALAG